MREDLVNRTFVDDAIDLTWRRRVTGCMFDGCIVTFNLSSVPTRIDQCIFESCLLQGDGWEMLFQ